MTKVTPRRTLRSSTNLNKMTTATSTNTTSSNANSNMMECSSNKNKNGKRRCGTSSSFQRKQRRVSHVSINRTTRSTTAINDNNNSGNASNMDDIANLNQVGIANLYKGDALVAKESFISALSRCAGASSVVKNVMVSSMNNMTLLQNSTTSSNSKKLEKPTKPTKTTTTKQTANKTHANLQSGQAEDGLSSTSKDGSSNNMMHVYQREEYDEGMHVYREALYLDIGVNSKALRDATLMYNVGQTHLRTRQYHEAKHWFELALSTYQEAPSRTNMDSDDSASTSSDRLNAVMIHHNIAFCHYCVGENDAAMDQYQAAFRRLQALKLGDVHVAACCNSIGILHLCKGSLTDSAKAMECLQLSLSIYKRVLGHDTLPVATCLSNIARVFFSRQDFPTALSLFQEALKIRQTIRQQKQKQQVSSSSSSPITITGQVDEAAAMFNIGQTYQKLGQTAQALDHFQAFRKLAEPVLGPGHRDVATCIKAMACIHYEAGALDTACQLLEEAVACSRQVLAGTATEANSNDYSLELACLLRDMGCLYSMTNQTKKALASHKESLKIQRVAYQDDHTNPSIMVTLLHIAQNEKKLGNYTQALNVYRTVYAIQLDCFGPKSLEVAATLCSIGLMLYLKQDLQSSLNYYQEALRVRQEFFHTNDNFDIAATFNSIGLIAFKMNKLDLARTSFQECIQVRVKLEGTDCHRDIVTLYSNLGTVFLASGQDKEAIQMFAESIRLERKTLGDNHLGVAVSLQHLAQLHQDRGELELAHQYFADALRITRDVDESLMANKQRTICTLLNLMGNIHLMKAEIPQMMECFIEASRVCDRDYESLVIAGYTFYGISKMHPPCAAEA